MELLCSEVGPSLSGTFPGGHCLCAARLLRPWLVVLQIWYTEVQRTTSSHLVQQEQYAECIKWYIMLSTMNNRVQGISNWALKSNGHFWPPLCALTPCLQNGKCTAFPFCRVNINWLILGKHSYGTLKWSLEKTREKLLILLSEQGLGCKRRHRDIVRSEGGAKYWIAAHSFSTVRCVWIRYVKMVWNDAVIKDPIMRHKRKKAVVRYLLSLTGSAQFWRLNADFFYNVIL